MYLTMLNYDEKRMFLKLAVSLASIDGDYSDEERAMVESYCKEMDIPQYDVDIENLDKILEEINNTSSIQTKKIILFEAVGLVLIDQYLEAKEQEAIEKMQNTFELTQEYTDECKKIINDYLEFQTRINSVVLGI